MFITIKFFSLKSAYYCSKSKLSLRFVKGKNAEIFLDAHQLSGECLVLLQLCLCPLSHYSAEATSSENQPLEPSIFTLYILGSTPEPSMGLWQIDDIWDYKPNFHFSRFP